MRILAALIVIVCVALPGFGDEGFTPIFNGKDLTGWRTFLPANAKAKADEIWSVKDGIINVAGAGKPMGYIITDKEFGDYVLKFQWRFPAGTPGGNSGVFVHVHAPDKIWPKGIEAQLQSGQAGDFWLVDGAKLEIDPTRNNPGSSRNYIRIGERWEKSADGKSKAIRNNVEKPLGQWNLYEIVCDKNNIRLFVNGQLVNEGKNGELSKGRILLQAEGADIQFRNIEVKSK